MGDYKSNQDLQKITMDKTGMDEYFAEKYGPAVGFGYTANIYRHGSSVYKVYSPAFGKETLFRETYVQSCVEAAGINCPSVLGVRYEGGFFLTETKYIGGGDMLSRLFEALAQKDMEGIKNILAELAKLQASINGTDCPELPSYKEYSRKMISGNNALSEETIEKTLEYLKSLPDGTGIVHGDFHPQNILYDEDGKAYVIDWVEGGMGAIGCDMARTYMNLKCLPPVPVFHSLDADLGGIYMDCCRQIICNLEEDDILAWLPVHAAINYGNKEPWYNEMIKKYLL